MKKNFSLVILATGTGLLISGINTHDAAARTPGWGAVAPSTDHGLWLIIGGLVGIITGGLGAMFQRRGKTRRPPPGLTVDGHSLASLNPFRSRKSSR